MSDMNPPNETYDIIFAGGGTTACVTAGRLAEMDPSLKILVLEAGAHTLNVPQYTQPGRFFQNLLRGIDAFTFHVSQPTEAVANRPLLVPVGRAVGGSSAINYLVYSRAAASDYDDWEQVYGNKGWGSKDLIPLLKKVETYQSEAHNDTHGDSGPLKVSFAKSLCNIGEEWVKVGPAFDTARSGILDMNDFNSTNGYGRCARYIDTETGKRSDAAHHYIYDKQTATNLTVLAGQRVIRVIFEDKRAVGVEYISDSGRRDQTLELPKKVALASKLVVLSSGAFGSPAILERSGIGASAILSKNGIDQIVDLPGVGENAMDHILTVNSYHASDDAETMDGIPQGSEENIEVYVNQWKADGTGPLSSNAMDAGIKIRPVGEDFAEIGPDFTHRWNTYFAERPDRPVAFIGTIAAYGGVDPLAEPHRNKYFSLSSWLAYPISTGHVHITDGSNPYSQLDFVLRFLEHSADLGLLRWIYKHGREVSRRMRFYRGELALSHPAFPAGSAAECKVADGPVPISAPKIVYTAEDDKAIDDFHRATAGTTYHPSGTCAMKSRADGGVVNERLDVYGVQRLKVADLSIIPSNVGANTYNTALGIGEKAAILIAEELGLAGVAMKADN